MDPDSPQADELRHLLNVVSGRARDEQGSMSEPIVKEELAIVEFLTAKSTTKPNATAANGAGANGQPRNPDGSDENTPVDLLLGLAKTNSGRRAAEEEKRQLRLQQRREQEEQRMSQRRSISAAASAANSNNNNNNSIGNGNNSGALSSSPWGYVAPQMPGLDVHQPFGGQQGSRRMPRPLQPPGAGKQDGEPNDGSLGSWGSQSDNPFAFTDNKHSSPGFTTPGGLIPSPHNTFANAANANQMNLSPYQDMTLPLPNAEDQLASLAQQNADALFSAPEFGAADVGSFDFSNLGVSQQDMAMAFNPFAIQQTGDEP